MAGLFLYALVHQGDENDSYHNHQRAWFDDRFAEAKHAIVSIAGEPNDVGTYTGTFDQQMFHYAVWKGNHADLVLLQHQEGDANFGHDATVDIRIIPRNNTQLVFPLNTDLIF